MNHKDLNDEAEQVERQAGTNEAPALSEVSRKTAANRVNAEKSTGPRTEEGKRRSSLNSIKHGILASDATIAVLGEGAKDVEQLKALRDDLIDFRQPDNIEEALLVDDIATNRWRRWRVIRAEAREMSRQSGKGIGSLPRPSVADPLLRYETTFSRAESRARGELERLQRHRRAKPGRESPEAREG